MSRNADLVCDVCGSSRVRLVAVDHLASTPAILRCVNDRCQRQEFRVLRQHGQVLHCGAPGSFRPRSSLHSAVKQANRERAMENLPPLLDRAIRHGLLLGVEDV